MLLDDHCVLVNDLNYVLLIELDFLLIKRSFSYKHVDLGQLSHSLYLHVIIKIIILTLVLKLKRPFYIKIIMNKSERVQKLSQKLSSLQVHNSGPQIDLSSKQIDEISALIEQLEKEHKKHVSQMQQQIEQAKFELKNQESKTEQK